MGRAASSATTATRTTRTARTVLAASVAASLLASCGAEQGARVISSRPVDVPAEATAAQAEPAGPAEADAEATGVLSPKEVLAAIGPSVAFIGTEWATGTAIAIEDGYLVTNAHVVVPFDQVAVTRPGGDTEYFVPVVGVDFDSDLALIGPLDDPMPPASYEIDPLVESGDEVYLVGYPSETEESPDPTIAEGIVSRFRDVDDFDQHFIQTDADIAGGQSGGALVDRRGNVIGISGMSLDEAFALALDFDDVLARLDHLRDGGQPWQSLEDKGRTMLEMQVPMHLDTARLDMTWASRDEEITLAFDGLADPGLAALEIFLDDGTYLVSRSMLAVTATWQGITEDEVLADVGEENVLDPDADGVYRFDLPEFNRATVNVVRTTPGEAIDVTLRTNRPVRLLEDADEGTPIGIGDELTGVIEPLELQDRYTVDLAAGQTISIAAESAIGDVAFTVVEPGATFGPDSYYVDDSHTGLAGLDAHGRFTAQVAGPHQIVVWDNFGQSGYHLSVDRD